MATSLETPTTPTSADEVANGAEKEWTVPPEAIPNVENLVIEDGKPVDSIFVEKQQRLLTQTLYCSWSAPCEGGAFLVVSNVGLFYKYGDPPFVPDVMLSLKVSVGGLSIKDNRSYFVWVKGKVPEVVIEIVSDKRGGEETHKMLAYAQMGISYYVIFDPEGYLGKGILRAFGLNQGIYEELEDRYFPRVGLGLTMWEGEFERHHRTWLRWCDSNKQVIPTGRERVEQERLAKEQAQQRAEQAQQRAERLAQQLRELGRDPVE
jgi:Uma2 family endonuclease